MYNFNFNVQNIEDGQGLGIALTGMIIVFSVLTLISVFIVILPKILAVVAKKFPESVGHHGVPVQDEDDGSALAAIGFVMHMRRSTEIKQKV